VSHRPEPCSKTGNDPPAPRPSFGTSIKELFGKLAQAITGKPTPALVARRKRREEETWTGFKLAFHKIIRRIPRPKTPPVEAARLWLADTLDWLQLWHEESVIEMEPCNDPARPDAYTNDFSTGPQM
jgi:hypothetical protein